MYINEVLYHADTWCWVKPEHKEISMGDTIRFPDEFQDYNFVKTAAFNTCTVQLSFWVGFKIIDK